MNTNGTTAPARKYKRHDEAFQRSVVGHWMLSGKSARQIARELGINVQSLQNWKQKFKALPAGQCPFAAAH
ncbi:MAG: transposase [Limisphaerales bacterium]